MDQLTEMELLQIREHLDAEALAVKKCQLYGERCADRELKQVLTDAARTHQAHLDALIDQLRRLNGKAPAPRREN